jgi:hypothetical protein
MAKLVRQAESPAAWISRTINDSDSKIVDLNIRSIAGVGPEREGESQKIQWLAYGLKVVYRTFLQPGFPSYAASEVLSICKRLWRGITWAV